MPFNVITIPLSTSSDSSATRPLVPSADLDAIRALSTQAHRAQVSNDAKADMLELEYLLRAAELQTQQAYAFEQLEAARQAEVNVYLQRQRDAIAAELSEQRPSLTNTYSGDEAGPYTDAESVYYTDNDDHDEDEEEGVIDSPQQEVYDLAANAQIDLAGMLANADASLAPVSLTLAVQPLTAKPPPVLLPETTAALTLRRATLSTPSEARRESWHRKRSSHAQRSSDAGQEDGLQLGGYSRKTKHIPVKRSIAGFALQKGAAKRLARNVHKREHVHDEEENAEVIDENMACTYLGNCMCKQCREERGD